MNQLHFDGQQEGERILAELHPDPKPLSITFGFYIIITLFFIIVVYSFGAYFPSVSTMLHTGTLVIGVSSIVFLAWWYNAHFKKTVTYITDRRIIRFEMLSPVYMAKRSLFWNEVLKAKAYSTNLIWRLANIGSVQIESQAQEHESIIVPNVGYFNDLANYIDKILFTFKNDPSALASFKPFIFAARGHRDSY